MPTDVHATDSSPIPAMVDASSGDPLLLVTDHYQVLDVPALTNSLAACTDVTAMSAGGWQRQREDGDGFTRALAAINPDKGANRIEVFYRPTTRGRRTTCYAHGPPPMPPADP
jgi:hypothetical protein